ncbi:MAG: cell division protein FtsA [Candidatus Cloacimonetes bacterium]|nr:cell division protein FtsA [Candidatus Cloacimonadota bacterium]
MKKKQKDIITVVDIGTTKVCTVIAEKKISEEGEVNFIVKGFGLTASEGMVRSAVVEMNKASTSIDKSIKAAEKMAQINAANIYIGIAGDHIRSGNFKGEINLSATAQGAKKKITQEDIDLVINDAKKTAGYQPDFANLKIIHAIPHYFNTDNGRGIPNPLGMEASSLFTKVHIVFANEANVNNILSCFKISGYNVNPENIVLEPIASSYAVLNEDQKELGAIMIDIGGGTTDVAIYYRKSIRFSAVFPFGGYELTRKLSGRIVASPSTTEILKIKMGQATIANIDPNEDIEVADITGNHTKLYNRQQFANDIIAEMSRLIKKIYHHISQGIAIESIKAGIYLTGGAANLKGLDDLIMAETNMKCTICTPDLSLFQGRISSLEKPEFSTTVGIFLYVLDNQIKKGFNSVPGEPKTNFFKRSLKIISGWFI